MLKYISTDIVFQEVPDEISLAISITGCPNHCPDCHSKYLWEDTGIELTEEEIDKVIGKYNDNITCVCFMGGDNDKHAVYEFAKYIKNKYSNLKIAWYSGCNGIDKDFPWQDFDYIKVGPYIQKHGPLDSGTSNQYMLKKTNNAWENITYLFYKNKHVNTF